MALLPEEKKRLEILGARRGIKPNILPLTWDGFKITLYQFAEKKCPFLGGNNYCTIYQWRPLVCRMYPLHPYGVSECTYLNRLQLRGFQVVYPPSLEAAAKKYTMLVVPRIKAAVKRYNLNSGWEPANRPLHFKYRLTYGRIPTGV